MTSNQHHLTIHNELLPIVIRKHKRARRMILRYQPLRHEISLTLPRYVSIRQGLHFVKEKSDWLSGEVLAHTKKIPLADGATFPLLGTDYQVKHIGGRGVVQRVPEEELLLIPGGEEFIQRRVRDWLKLFAKETIESLVKEKSIELDVAVAKISLRDTSSLWGSCSKDGRLCFSWRLVFAPYEVLEYVVCHEVAHLKELNHGKAFWRLVEELCPDWKRQRKWLTANGSTLYRFSC